MGEEVEKWGKRANFLISVPRRKNIIFGNRGWGKNIIFWQIFTPAKTNLPFVPILCEVLELLHLLVEPPKEPSLILALHNKTVNKKKK